MERKQLGASAPEMMALNNDNEGLSIQSDSNWRFKLVAFRDMFEPFWTNNHVVMPDDAGMKKK